MERGWQLGPKRRPDAGSDVVIGNGSTVNYNTLVEINTLTLSSTSGLDVSGGNLTIDGASTLNGKVIFVGGTLTANGPETLAGNTSWTAGTLSSIGTGSWTNTGSIKIAGTGSPVLSGTLNNVGTFTQAAPNGFNTLNFNNGVLNNSGLYDVQENGTPFANVGGSGDAFNNLSGGIFQKSAGTGITSNGSGLQLLPFSNAGTLKVLTGTLNLDSVPQADVGSTTLTAGTWDVFAHSTLTLDAGIALTTNDGNITLSGSGASFTNIPNLTVNNGGFTLANGQSFTTTTAFTNAGSLTIDATGGSDTFTATEAYTQTAGSTTLISGGTLASTTNTVTIQAGTLQGEGSVTGNLTDSGTLSPGTASAAGSIAISGNLTLGLGATLNIELAGGTTPGTDYDQIAVSGTATLGGTLAVTAINSFVPANGDVFHVLTFGSSSGDFTSQTGFVFGGVFLVASSSASAFDVDAFVSTITVNNASDAHVGGEWSLREALVDANAGSLLGVDVTIDFAAGLAGATIPLSQGALELGQGGAGTGSIAIDGSGLSSPITISGKNTSQIFRIDADVQASLTDLDLTAGGGSSDGGAILNDGTLTITGGGISNSSSNDSGGGIDNAGTLTLTDVTLTDNTATNSGGAIISSGSFTVAGCTFSGNQVTGGGGDGGGAIAVTSGSAAITGSNFAGNRITSQAISPADSAGGAIVTFVAGSTIEFNRFSGNTNATAAHGTTVAVIAPATATVDDNWWTSNAGPATNDVVIGNAGGFSPQPVDDFLVLSIAANASTVSVSTSTTVTASFTTDSAGNTPAPANLGVLANLPASFGGNTLAGSSITGSPTTVQNGQASATYHAGTVGGTDRVTATVDGVAVLTTITVQQPVAITSNDHYTFTVGTPGTFTVTTASFPNSVLAESEALPSGVHFLDNGDGTATLSGTPAVGTGNQYTLTITASNGISPEVQQTFTLTVDEAPSITSTRTTTFNVDADTPFIVTTLGFPRPTLAATGAMPAGVGFVDQNNGTAILSGNALPNTGAYVFSITAHNSRGNDVVQTFTLNVVDPPMFTAATGNSATFTVGQKQTIPIATNAGLPLTTTITETGKLPAGLSLILVRRVPRRSLVRRSRAAAGHTISPSSPATGCFRAAYHSR